MSLFQRLAKVLLGGALLAGAFAAVFFFAAASPPPTPRISEAYDPAAEHPQRLSIHDPRLQGVLRLMLNSDRLWQSLDVRARYTEYAYQANPQAPAAPGAAQGKTTFIEEIHIQKPWAVTYRQFLEGQSQPRYQVAWQANATQTGGVTTKPQQTGSNGNSRGFPAPWMLFSRATSSTTRWCD